MEFNNAQPQANWRQEVVNMASAKDAQLNQLQQEATREIGIRDQQIAINNDAAHAGRVISLVTVPMRVRTISARALKIKAAI